MTDAIARSSEVQLLTFISALLTFRLSTLPSPPRPQLYVAVALVVATVAVTVATDTVAPDFRPVSKLQDIGNVDMSQLTAQLPVQVGNGSSVLPDLLPFLDRVAAVEKVDGELTWSIPQ
ncbi:hypothetical protein C8R44DRAFT_992141 [Mycena epipterygia]|nr:hypothetical protein C8R44DRAFT_992141 [Mycena epipterygia]